MIPLELGEAVVEVLALEEKRGLPAFEERLVDEPIDVRVGQPIEAVIESAAIQGQRVAAGFDVVAPMRTEVGQLLFGVGDFVRGEFEWLERAPDFPIDGLFAQAVGGAVDGYPI